jgi:uncharacterized membrane protein
MVSTRTWEQALAIVHVLAPLSALGAEAAVLLLPKGTHTRRVIGTVYVLALVLVNGGRAELAIPSRCSDSPVTDLHCVG